MVVALEEHDVVAALGGDRGGPQTGRAGADDRESERARRGGAGTAQSRSRPVTGFITQATSRPANARLRHSFSPTQRQ